MRKTFSVLKTGKHTKSRSHSGFLLAIVGLGKAVSSPLFDASAPTQGSGAGAAGARA